MAVDLTLPSSGPPEAQRLFRREFIPGDRELQPFQLQGFRRALFLIAYAAITATAVCGLAFVIFVEPLFGLSALAIGYVLENVSFLHGHMRFHAAFIEMPEEEMPTLYHLSFLHHYRNVRTFHENWLESRISYFIDPRSGPGSVLGIGIAGALVLAAAAYYVSPIFAIALYACRAIPLLMQSVVHEWYHNPARNRRTFYSAPVFWFLTALEKTGLASTRRHAAHHGHTLKDLDRVDVWLDLYLPLERFGKWLWAKTLSVYEPGKRNMSNFLQRGALGVLPRNLLFFGSYTAAVLVTYRGLVS